MKNFNSIKACLCLLGAVSCLAADKQPVELVNPFMGTLNPGGLSKGITIPAVAWPFPMNAWTAATGAGDGYDYAATKINGFRQRHLHTSRMGEFANFSLMAVFGNPVTTPTQRASAFTHDKEIAQPSYYKVHLDTWNATAEMTATERAACFRFTYEQDGDGCVILDIAPAADSSVEIIPGDNKITAISRNHEANASVPRDGSFGNYIVIVFDRPFTGYGVFAGPPGRGGRGAQQEPPAEGVKDNETKLTGQHVGAYVKFATGQNKIVGCKVASSYISAEQAMLNLQNEIGSANFDTVRQHSEARWNQMLGRIRVEGATEQEQRTFYSCLYRSLLFPEKFYEINAQGKQVHYSPYDGKLHDGPIYTDSGFWDTFRAAHPLYNLICPEVSAEIQQSLLNTYDESGWLPEWPAPGHSGVMIGQHSFSLLADAWMKGIRGFDAEKAVEAMVHDVTGSPRGAVGRDHASDYDRLGYLPFSSTRGQSSVGEATAKTLEYAYDDFCAAQLAHAVGRQTNADLFAKHAMNYTNLFDTNIGFMRERRADGTWNEPFAPETWSGGFTEGSSWHWTWCAFQDIPGLVKLMGGNEAFGKKLDEVFTTSADAHLGGYHGSSSPIHEMMEMVASDMGQYAHGNEPVHHMIYLYDYVGQPWKAQSKVRQAMALFYNATPDGYCGDEDTGQMSAWYVFSAMGFYPVCPGDPNYLIGSPLFDKVTVSLQNGKTFTVTAKGNGYQEYYIRGATLNGETLNKTYFSHKDILDGADLVLMMNSQPNKKWGSAPENLPPSALATLLGVPSTMPGPTDK
jgi:predicted alpha-1,2-mannosidase